MALKPERILRRLVPSGARLTYNPVFKIAVNAADWPVRRFFPEFRALPPNHLRIRVGVRNAVFRNQLNHLISPARFWMFAFANDWCDLDSTIIDIGCGCGRYAASLRDLSMGDLSYRAHYYGVDIDTEMIAWCKDHFDAPRFTFFQATGRSVTYHQGSGSEKPYEIPLPDATADFVFSTSLFTHLLEHDLANYVVEIGRLLRPGGCAVHSFFSLDHLPTSYGGRHTFRFAYGEARVESLRQPEAAVAYRDDYIATLFAQAGLDEVTFLGGEQRTVLARRS
jgi:SAM-dependent methyltransferase